MRNMLSTRASRLSCKAGLWALTTSIVLLPAIAEATSVTERVRNACRAEYK